MPESRLTIAAKALGFAESASSVDLLAQAQGRLVENQQKLEAAKLGGTVGDVAKLTDEQQKLSTVVDELTPAQEKLRVSTELYGGLLGQISPQLGHLVTNMLRGANVAGKLAAENLNLGDVFKRVTGAVDANSQALALLGAGGAVAIGIAAIVSVVEKMGQEFERTTEAIKRQQAAVNDLKRSQQENQQSIEAISDTRREGGLGADAARQAQSAAASISERFGGALEPEAINRAVALLGDQGLDEEQLGEAAFLLQRGTLTLDEKQRGPRRRGAFERASRRDRTAFETFRSREAAQRRESVQSARQEAIAEGGSTVDIEGFVRQTLGPGASDEEIQRAVAGVEKFGNLQGLAGGIEQASGVVANLFTPLTAAKRALFGETAALPLGEQGRFLQTPEVLNREDLANLTRVLERLGDEPRTVINNNNQNWRNIVPGASAQERARDNGAAMAELAEMGVR